MKWRGWVSRALTGAAMTGGAALIVFVGAPWLMEPPPAPQPPSIEGIVTGALTPSLPADEAAQEGESLGDGPEADVTTAPLVAVRNNGEEVSVVFPAATGEPPEEETTRAGDDLAVGLHEEAEEAPAQGLPPVLSAEEIAVAMEALEAVAEEEADVLAVASETPSQIPEADETESAGALVGQAAEPLEPSELSRMHDEAGRAREGESLRDEAPAPPPSATREVQELLEALGYAPGPLDGIWGERTAGAWRRFARDAAARAPEAEAAQPQPESVAEVELVQSRQQEAAGPLAADMPPPSGGAVDPEGTGAEQAGVYHRRTGLPAREPVVAPQTLRGVMGYRMPLVSRQGVPDQVVSGVLIPAHTTFVILQPGRWELVGLSEEEARLLREGSEKAALVEPEGESLTDKTRRFRLFDVFRRKERREAE